MVHLGEGVLGGVSDCKESLFCHVASAHTSFFFLFNFFIDVCCQGSRLLQKEDLRSKLVRPN